MAELFLPIGVFLATVLGWGLYALDQIRRGEKILPAPPSRAAIPKDIQGEIDQTPAWWDAQFAALQRTLPGYQEIENVIGKEIAPYVVAVHPPLKSDGRPSWVGRSRFSPGGHLPDPPPPTTAELHPGEFALSLKTPSKDPQEAQKALIALLEKSGIEASRVYDEDFDEDGYWYMTDEYDYDAVHTLGGEEYLYGGERVKEWCEWPEGFDFERMVTLWRVARGR